MFNLLRTCQTVPTNPFKGPDFSLSSPTLLTARISGCSHIRLSIKDYFISFWFVLPLWRPNGTGHLFMCPWTICLFPGKCPCRSSVHFFILVTCIFLTELQAVFIFSNCKSRNRSMICKYLIPLQWTFSTCGTKSKFLPRAERLTWYLTSCATPLCTSPPAPLPCHRAPHAGPWAGDVQPGLRASASTSLPYIRTRCGCHLPRADRPFNLKYRFSPYHALPPYPALFPY